MHRDKRTRAAVSGLILRRTEQCWLSIGRPREKKCIAMEGL